MTITSTPRRAVVPAAIAAFFVLSTESIGAQENYTADWAHHLFVNLNTTATGAGVAADVRDFPVLVRLGAADSAIFAQAKAGGADLRFTKADDATRLHHVIDTWDSAGRKAAVWVKADTVRGNNNAQHLRLHWGNAAAADSSNGTAVFSNGFTNVWHLGNAPAAQPRPNAIAGGNPATPVNFPGDYAPAEGIIGAADRLRGGPGAANATANDHLDLGTITTDYSGGFTFSAWLHPDAEGFGTAFYAASEGTTNGNGLIVLGQQGSPPGAKFRFRNSGTSNVGIINDNFGDLAGIGAWMHVTFTKAAGNGQMDVYLNGTLASSDFGAGLEAISGVTRTVNILGSTLAHMNYNDSSFNGRMDEARLANTGRSDAWVRLEHENQKLAQTLVSLGTTVSLAPAVAGRGRFAELSVNAFRGGVEFRFGAARTGTARLELRDVHGRVVWSQAVAPDARRMVWDGRTSAGGAASAGVYAARLETVGDDGTTRVSTGRVPLLR